MGFHSKKKKKWWLAIALLFLLGSFLYTVVLVTASTFFVGRYFYQPQLADLQRDLVKSQAQLSALNATLAKKDQEISQLRSDLAAARASTAKLDARVNDLQSKLGQQEVILSVLQQTEGLFVPATLALSVENTEVAVGGAPITTTVKVSDRFGFGVKGAKVVFRIAGDDLVLGQTDSTGTVSLQVPSLKKAGLQTLKAFVAEYPSVFDSIEIDHLPGKLGGLEFTGATWAYTDSLFELQVWPVDSFGNKVTKFGRHQSLSFAADDWISRPPRQILRAPTRVVFRSGQITGTFTITATTGVISASTSVEIIEKPARDAAGEEEKKSLDPAQNQAQNPAQNPGWTSIRPDLPESPLAPPPQLQPEGSPKSSAMCWRRDDFPDLSEEERRQCAKHDFGLLYQGIESYLDPQLAEGLRTFGMVVGEIWRALKEELNQQKMRPSPVE